MARKYRPIVYDENQRFIYPTSDWGFKHIFGTEKNKDILLGVLQRLLPELNIESIEHLPRDITIPVGNMKDTRFDVFCRLQDGSNVVVEMQNYADKSFLDRSLVYSASAILEHHVNSKLKNKRYKISRTIFLAFLGDPLFRDVGRTPVRLSLCDIDEVTTIVRNDKLLQIFVELPKFAGSLDQVDENTPFVEKLAHVMMEMADCRSMPDNLGDPILEDVFKAADRLQMSMEEKENYMMSVLGEFEYYANIEEAREAAREEGLEEGREKGLEEGREKGLEEGREKGLEEGREKGLEEGFDLSRREVARNMKAEGFALDIIAKCTNLDLEIVKTL